MVRLWVTDNDSLKQLKEIGYSILDQWKLVLLKSTQGATNNVSYLVLWFNNPNKTGTAIFKLRQYVWF